MQRDHALDALRFLFFLAVFLFHVGLFDAGYLGVDGFFVLSGYFMARMWAGGAGVSAFYFKRLSRLMPPLLGTVAATMAYSAVVASPTFLEEINTSALATVFGVSNVLFWLQAGYFDTASAYKPLLHTWSLSVELQFYLIFPLVAIMIGRSRVRMLVALAATGAVALPLQSVPDFAFFMLPARLFEFALGMAVFHFTGGTGLSRFNGVLSGRRLAWLPLLGRMSYSLYLVHWPVIVFLRYHNFDRVGLNVTDIAIAAVLTAVLGAASYWLLERRRIPLRYFTIGGAMVLLFGATVSASEGLDARPWFRFTGGEIRGITASEIDEAYAARDRMVRLGTCYLGADDTADTMDFKVCFARSPDRPNVVVLGDSHGGDVYAALAAAFPEVNFMQATGSGCFPAVGHSDERCQGWLAAAKQQASGVDAMVVAARWDDEEHARWLMDDAPELEAIAPVVIIGAGPVFYRDVPETISRFGPNQTDALTENHHVALANQALADFARTNSQVTFVDKRSAFCAERCNVVSKDGSLLFVNYGHLSPAGIAHLARYFRASLNTELFN